MQYRSVSDRDRKTDGSISRVVFTNERGRAMKGGYSTNTDLGFTVRSELYVIAAEFGGHRELLPHGPVFAFTIHSDRRRMMYHLHRYQCLSYMFQISVDSMYSVSNPPPLRFFPKRLGIFKQFFTHLLHVPFYTRLQIFSQLFPTLAKLCHTKRDHPAIFFTFH